MGRGRNILKLLGKTYVSRNGGACLTAGPGGSITTPRRLDNSAELKERGR